MALLSLNGGSSSWKSALFDDVPQHATEPSEPRVAVSISWESADDRATVTATVAGEDPDSRAVRVDRGAGAVGALVSAYAERGVRLADVRAVGHRIVHGGPHLRSTVRIDTEVEAELARLESLAPQHNPIERAGIDGVRSALGDVPQFAVFDTTFHRTLAPEAYAYAGPYAWLARDIRRYGFHGVSVAYCSERLRSHFGRNARPSGAIVAHLGGGCSVTAIADGASVDTSMGYTPLDGVAMGTRSGAVDPGIVLQLVREAGGRGLDAAAAADDVEATLEKHSGLRGLSERSSDVRVLARAHADGDVRAGLALDVFARRVATAIAGMLPALERFDALAFTGGIGEHAAFMRERICAKLAFAGVRLDAELNARAAGDATISQATSAVFVAAIETREEWFVARECARALAGVATAP